MIGGILCCLLIVFELTKPYKSKEGNGILFIALVVVIFCYLLGTGWLIAEDSAANSVGNWVVSSLVTFMLVLYFLLIFGIAITNILNRRSRNQVDPEELESFQ